MAFRLHFATWPSFPLAIVPLFSFYFHVLAEAITNRLRLDWSKVSSCRSFSVAAASSTEVSLACFHSTRKSALNCSGPRAVSCPPLSSLKASHMIYGRFCLAERVQNL